MMVKHLEFHAKDEDARNDNNGSIVDKYYAGYGWYDGHGVGCGVSTDYDLDAGLMSGGSMLPYVDDSDSWLMEYLES